MTISIGANAVWCLMSSGWTLWCLRERALLMKASADWDTCTAILLQGFPAIKDDELFCLSKSITKILPLICSCLWWNFCLWWLWLDLANSSATGFGNRTHGQDETAWLELTPSRPEQCRFLKTSPEYVTHQNMGQTHQQARAPLFGETGQHCLPIVAHSAKTDWFTWTAIANNVTITEARHGQQ